MDNNLLKRLYTYASYQDENFTTESFVHLLEYLRQNEYKALVRLGRKITGGLIRFDLYDPNDVTIITQVDTEEGTPDIEISGPDFIIFIEVKVDSPLGDRQLERYRKAISTYEKEKQLLILLSRYPYEADGEILDFNLRWTQIGDWLEEERTHEDLGNTANYLIEQFTQFLQFRGLMFTPPRTRLSRWLKHYLRREKNNSIFYQKIIRSLRALDGERELQPLQHMLKSMETALRNTLPNAKVMVSSAMKSRKGGEWIGFSINTSDLFFSIYLQEADNLVFETYHREIDPGKLEDKPGRIFESDGRKRWENTLDCGSTDLDFYAKSAHEQLTILEQFLEECKLILELA